MTRSTDFQPSAGRLVSLDVFRGMTIAAMVLVNNPGDWGHVYAPLLHAEWNGWTPTDLVFPFFLFIVGVAMAFSLDRYRTASGAPDKKLWVKVIRRSLLLFGLGLFLSLWPWFEIQNLRIPGVLQRIALCYLIGAVIMMKTDWRGQLGATVACLGGYWLLMEWVPVPGFGSGDLTPGRNLANSLDSLLIPGRLYQGSWDPEGLLSTIPAVGTTLSGVLTGHFVRSGRSRPEIGGWLFAAGWGCLALGLLWGVWFPINKNLWTSSYVLFSSGAALQVLGLCYWLIDVTGLRRWSFPFEVFGMNALALFVLSGLLAKTMAIRLAGPPEAPVTLQSILYSSLFTGWLSPYNASLAFALSQIGIWWVVMWLLYRRGIFIKL